MKYKKSTYQRPISSIKGYSAIYMIKGWIHSEEFHKSLVLCVIKGRKLIRSSVTIDIFYFYFLATFWSSLNEHIFSNLQIKLVFLKK